MQTNFFSLIDQMNISGFLKLVIAKTGDGKMVLTVLLNNDQCTDKAQQLIKPMNLTAEVSELDAHFFESITKPMQHTSSLLDSMQQYMADLEEAKAKSSMEMDKQVKETKVLSAKEKKYKELLDQSLKLEADSKYREAWTKMPDPIEYPQYAEAIRERKQGLSAKFPPDLFASVPEPVVVQPAKAAEHLNDTDTEPIDDPEPEELEYNEYSGLESDDVPF